MSELQDSVKTQQLYPPKELEQSYSSIKNISKFLAFSLIGIFMFFIPIHLNGKSSIPLDHFVTWIRSSIGAGASYYVLIIVILGAVHPFYKKTRNKNAVEIVISIFKILGAIATF